MKVRGVKEDGGGVNAYDKDKMKGGGVTRGGM